MNYNEIIAATKSDLMLCETLRAAKAKQIDEYGHALRMYKGTFNSDAQFKLGQLIMDGNRAYDALSKERTAIIKRLNELKQLATA